MNRTSPFPGLVDPIGLVRKMACQVTSTYPHCVHMDDVVGQGLLALVRCQRRFDPRRGVKFSTYAWSRVRFAMVDLVRAEAKRRMFLRAEDLPELAGESSVEEDILVHESVDHLHDAVSRLPARQAQYVHWILAGNSETHVCRRMEITRGAGRELRVRALVNLKKELGAEPEGLMAAAR